MLAAAGIRRSQCTIVAEIVPYLLFTIGLALLVTSLLTLAQPYGTRPRLPRLVVFDVGQGDAVLVQGREASVLVDAGVALPEGPDRGRDVVLPALAALGVAALDLLVVTHVDLDHRGGVPAVLEGPRP